MRHKQGTDRREMALLPASLEDYVSSDNPVRVIEAFVNALDLKALGYKNTTVAGTGRPPYDPADLLKLYLYGYLHKVASGRRLEKQCQCNIEVMWLMGKLAPDFKTITRFRAENVEGIAKTFEVLVKTTLKGKFIGKTLAAIDGSRFKGVNSRDKVFNEKDLEKRIEKAREKFQDYLRQMDELDKLENDEEKLTEEELNKRIEQIKEEVKKLQQTKQKLTESGQTQIATTDPDCRRMKVGSKATVGYNVQVAVDAKHKLIVAFKVTNDRADANNLFKMAQAAQQALGSKRLQVLADTGYYDCEEVNSCHQAGITPLIHKPADSSQAGKFSKRSFVYNPATDHYRCPAGEKMHFTRNVSKGDGRILRAYGTNACSHCQLKKQCTTNKNGRLIQRHINEHALERMALRVRKRSRLMPLRKQIVEHIFGCIKKSMGLGEFLTRGFRKVTAEFALTACAFDIRRLINLVGTKKLLRAFA